MSGNMTQNASFDTKILEFIFFHPTKDCSTQNAPHSRNKSNLKSSEGL